jgi:hypothetical protein
MRGLYFQITPSSPDGQSAFARQDRKPAQARKKSQSGQLCTKSVHGMPELDAGLSPNDGFPMAFRLGDGLFFNHKVMKNNNLWIFRKKSACAGSGWHGRCSKYIRIGAPG